jgi:hypothetical protein
MFDQADAEFGGELDRLIATYRRLVVRRGPDYAWADILALVHDGLDLDRSSMAALVAQAVKRLAGDDA